MTKLAAFAAALLLACACRDRGGADYARSGPSHHSAEGSRATQAAPGNRARFNPVMPQGNTAGAEETAATGRAVDVQLTEYQIMMPATLPPGDTTFNVAAAGKESHGLVIEGNGVRISTPEALMRGDRTTLHAILGPGTYTVYCPVDGHRGKGMERTLTVR